MAATSQKQDTKKMQEEVQEKIGAEKLKLLRQLCVEAVRLSGDLDEEGYVKAEVMDEFNNKLDDVDLNDEERQVVAYYLNLGLMGTHEKVRSMEMQEAKDKMDAMVKSAELDVIDEVEQAPVEDTA